MRLDSRAFRFRHTSDERVAASRHASAGVGIPTLYRTMSQSSAVLKSNGMCIVLHELNKIDETQTKYLCTLCYSSRVRDGVLEIALRGRGG